MSIMKPIAAATTGRLARHILSYKHADLSPEAIVVAQQCVLDWFAVTLGARQEPLVRLLEAEVGGRGPATLVGAGRKVSPVDAALVNGAASHALDYDDCHHLVGHPSVTVLPAALAIAEAQGASGRDLLRALVGGIEAAAAIGSVVLPDHYDRGFHATATLGAFGAAAAVGLLLDLDEYQMTMALGLAGAQAAGLKSMFGTMAKPFQAGKAAANGVLAARLAKSGFTAAEDVLDVDQGFIDTHGRAQPSSEMHIADPGEVIVNTLFKYHAACYLTHSTIEAIAALRERHRLLPEDIATVDVHVEPAHLKVCNILEPNTGLEVKFSLAHTSALAAFDIDTAAIQTYSDETARRPELVAFRKRVEVHADGQGQTAADVTLTLTSGETLASRQDVGVPARDLATQQARLQRKYLSLATPVIGPERAARLYDAIGGLDGAPTLHTLMD